MWIVLLIGSCFTVITAWQHHPSRPMVPITRLFVAPSADNNNDGIIDPFDGIKDLPKRTTSKKVLKKVRDSTESMSSPSTQQQTTVPITPATATADIPVLTIEERLMNRQAKMLQSLPADVFFDFRNVVEQLLPRIAVITCTVYVMMLIPILW